MATTTKNGLRAKLDEVNADISAKNAAAQEKWQAFEQARDQFASAGSEVNDTNSEAFKAAETVHKEYAAAAEELKGLERVRDGIFGMLAGEGPEQKGPESHSPETPESQTKSLADRAVESPQYKELLESGRLDTDRLPFSAKLADMTIGEVKALITGTSDTSGGAFITNERVGYVAQPRRTPKVLDLITMGQTNSDTVEYARQTAFTNVAAETAEATTTTTGTKPEATIAFEKVTAAVKTIAHWVPTTRRALADVGQLRTLIESQLRYGLEYRLESQVVNGAGTGETLTGIINTTNILSQPKGGDSVADAIHKAITQIRLGFIEPNGIALHPNDWEVVRLSKGSTNDHYLLGGPGMQVAEQLWGLPVAVSASVPDDTGIVGDFRQATLWMREGAQIYASDSHDDFFVKNLVALLAELRAAFGVLLPQAFCKVTSLD